METGRPRRSSASHATGSARAKSWSRSADRRRLPTSNEALEALATARGLHPAPKIFGASDQPPFTTPSKPRYRTRRQRTSPARIPWGWRRRTAIVLPRIRIGGIPRRRTVIGSMPRRGPLLEACRAAGPLLEACRAAGPLLEACRGAGPLSLPWPVPPSAPPSQPPSCPPHQLSIPPATQGSTWPPSSATASPSC